MNVESFTVDVDDAVLDDLQDRLRRTRWPVEPVDAGWRYGTPVDYTRRLVDHWLNAYDWRAAEARINGFDNYRARVPGLDVHFIMERGSGPDPPPLLLTHGWPGSVVEFLDVIEPLAHPERFGGRAEDSFTVVVPSIPGYGFSQAPPAPMTLRDVSDMWRTLMVDDLGFPSFFAQGGDQGSIVSTWLAFDHPECVQAVHLNSAPFLPLPDPEKQTAEERDWAAANAAWRRPEDGYRTQQGTRPTTLAYGLTDSPAGLAAWIVEKFKAWTVPGEDRDPPFSMDALLTDVMLYWLGGVNPASWYYISFYEAHNQLPDGGRVKVPTGFLLTPRDVSLFPPSSVLERAYNVVHRRHAVDGGHFLAFEQPELFLDEVRAFFRPFRRPPQA